MKKLTKTTLYVGHNVNNFPTWTHNDIIHYVVYGWGINDATFMEAQGVWKGGSEETTVITFIGNKCKRWYYIALKEALEQKFKQEEVLLEISKVETL